MLSVVLPFHSGVARLRIAVGRLERLAQRIRCELIVVNDGGPPDVTEWLHDWAIVVNCRHGGRSVARNKGASVARGSRILFLDSDVIADDNVLAFHAALADGGTGAVCRGSVCRGSIRNLPWLAAFEDPLIGTLTGRASRSLGLREAPQGLLSRRLPPEAIENPRVLAPLARLSGLERDLEIWLDQNPDSPDRWIGCTGGHLSVGAREFSALGGFDERMGLRWGAEDLEFGYRAVQAGIPLTHTNQTVVYHMDHDTSQREGDHEHALRYFAAKHADARILGLLDYFAGRCSMAHALERCHAAA